jgi:hypothetical protein
MQPIGDYRLTEPLILFLNDIRCVQQKQFG